MSLVQQNKSVRNKSKDNTRSDQITITKDKLYCKISRHYDKIKKKRNWIGVLGTFLSLLISNLTADFKNIFSIDPTLIKGIFVTLCVGSFIWLIYSVVIAIKGRKHNIDNLINDIFTKD